MLLDIPALLGEQRLTCGGETGDMCHLTAAYQRETGLLRQSKKVFEPVTNHFFRDGCGWRASKERGVLIPSRRQPISSQSSRQRAANHPAEEAATWGR